MSSPIFGSPSVFSSQESYQAYLAHTEEVKKLLAHCHWDLERTVDWKATMQQATQWSERAMKVLQEPELDDRDRAKLLYKIALWKFEKGDYQGSLKDQLELYQHCPEKMDNLRDIGNCYMVLGQPEKAQEFYAKTDSLLNRGNYYRSQKKYAEALQSYEKALQMKADALIRFKIYNNMGNVYSLKGKHAEALEKYQQAKNIGKTLFPQGHPEVAANLNNIGNYHYSQRSYDTAREYYGKALRMRLDLLGPDHPDVASSQRNMGNSFAAQAKADQALDYYRKASAILQKTLGLHHGDTQAVLAAIGSYYSKA